MFALVKRIPSSHLLSKWDEYKNTVEWYLSYNASTVRQTASSLFQALVAEDVDYSLSLTRNVFELLVGKWSVDTATFDKIVKLNVVLKIQPDIAQQRSKFAYEAYGPTLHMWQWIEGRLLAYELVLQHIINSHSQKLFPQMYAGITPKKVSPSMSFLRSPSEKAESYHSRKRAFTILERLRNIKQSDQYTVSIELIKLKLNMFVMLLKFKSFKDVLERMMHQVIDSYTVNSWEVRRMSNQILPLITEAFLWVAPKRIVHFCLNNLAKHDTLMCCVACMVSKNMLVRASTIDFQVNFKCVNMSENTGDKKK